MNTKTKLRELVLQHKKLSRHLLIVVFVLLVSLFVGLFLVRQFTEGVFVFWDVKVNYSTIGYLALIPIVFVLLVKWTHYLKSREELTVFNETKELIDGAMKSTNLEVVSNVLLRTEELAKTNQLIRALFIDNSMALNTLLGELRKNKRNRNLNQEISEFKEYCDIQLNKVKVEVPLFKAKEKLVTTLEHLEQRRDQIIKQWQLSYESFSWWNKCKYADGPDLSGMDSVITDLKDMLLNLDEKYQNEFVQLDEYFNNVKKTALARVETADASALNFIEAVGDKEGIDSELLKKSLWLSVLSIPVSAWLDVNQAGDVYEALRSVNGNFAEMSDTEIWWDTLLLPAESLVGLASLTKGAYFEQLVAADSGGELFEHFNHANTDIVIDGIEYQIKATDSVAYVNSVSDGIPVIATSEVAALTGDINSGYSNLELNESVDLALGGTVVDVGDSIADAILTGVGGLGFFATIEGINHAAKKYENGGDPVEAMFEGAGVAIEGTARALVGVAEIGYNVWTSRPSRYVGRALASGFEKLDNKLMGK